MAYKGTLPNNSGLLLERWCVHLALADHLQYKPLGGSARGRFQRRLTGERKNSLKTSQSGARYKEVQEKKQCKPKPS